MWIPLKFCMIVSGSFQDHNLNSIDVVIPPLVTENDCTYSPPASAPPVLLNSLVAEDNDESNSKVKTINANSSRENNNVSSDHVYEELRLPPPKQFSDIPLPPEPFRDDPPPPPPVPVSPVDNLLYHMYESVRQRQNIQRNHTRRRQNGEKVIRNRKRQMKTTASNGEPNTGSVLLIVTVRDYIHSSCYSIIFFDVVIIFKAVVYSLLPAGSSKWEG